ncbi:MAG: thioredoxin reductase [Desulfovibrionales bacterium]|jgi:thioredoxin reductase (NADPH)|nr:thioredoxin reductase [Desulfovibrionales bacterium]
MEEINRYDVIIAGSGPAGLQAAIHAARKKVSVLLLGRIRKSSLWWAEIENFCCLFRVSGEDMLTIGRQQAQNFGADMVEEDILDLRAEDDGIHIVAESGREFVGKALVLAAGATRNKLGVPGEKELLGKGVSYCVECDAGFYRNQDVALVGGGSAAAGGAVTMTSYASNVSLVYDKLDVADSLREKLASSGVKLYEGLKVEKILGESGVEGLQLSNGEVLPVQGVFIELGAKGAMELSTALGVQLDEKMRYIETDKKQQTNVPGVFAAGDICGPPLQMAKAVGEGCVAGIEAANYVKR